MKHLLYSALFPLILFVLSGMAHRSVAQGQKKRPNIFICMADDASFPFMGAYGTDWVKTPAFDRIAREGLLFMNAYTPNAKCAPSRSCLLTGRHSWQLEEAANHSPDFPAKFKTFMEALDEHQYWVGHTVKGWGPGNPGKVGGKRRELTGKAYNGRTLTPPSTGISKADYTGNFRDFLDQKKDVNQPFCFWYGSIEPHRDYEYASSLRAGKQPNEIKQIPAYWPDTDTVRTDMLDYAFELEYFDQHLGKMLKLLEERGELENTIVVVTADNGMPFPRVKGQAYEASNHVPMAIMWKGGIQNPGRRIKDFVSFIDLAPTFLELAGLNQQMAGMQPIEGKTLTDLFNSAKNEGVNPLRDHVLIGKERHDVGRPHDWGYPIRGIVKGGFLYVRNYETSRWPAGNPETGYLNTDGGATKTLILNGRRRGEKTQYWQMNFGKRPTDELYNLQNDPDCVKNLASQTDYRRLMKKLRTQMEQELRSQGDPRQAGNGAVFDSYPYSGEVNGFYERYLNGEKVKASWVNDSDFELFPVPDKLN